MHNAYLVFLAFKFEKPTVSQIIPVPIDLNDCFTLRYLQGSFVLLV